MKNLLINSKIHIKKKLDITFYNKIKDVIVRVSNLNKISTFNSFIIFYYLTLLENLNNNKIIYSYN